MGLGSAREQHKAPLGWGCRSKQGLQIHTEIQCQPSLPRDERESCEQHRGLCRAEPLVAQGEELVDRTSLVLGSPRQPWAVLEPETPGILPHSPSPSRVTYW